MPGTGNLSNYCVHENRHTSNILWTEQVISGNVCVWTHNTHMHAITVNERRGYEFEREWEGVYGTLWREKKQVIKVLILL